MSEPLIVAPPALTYKRYLLLKEFEANRMGMEALAAAWKGRRLELAPGTELPATFPFRSHLVSIGYGELELFDGATEEEIVLYTGLSPFDVRAVAAAANVLLTPPTI